LKEATDKNKRQAVKTAQKIAAAREEAEQAHVMEVERLEQAFKEDFAKANNRWSEKNGHLQAQVDMLKATLDVNKK